MILTTKFLRRGGRVLPQKRLCNYTQVKDWSASVICAGNQQHYFAALLGSLGADEGRHVLYGSAHMAQEVKALDMPAIDFCPLGIEEYWDIQNKTCSTQNNNRLGFG